MSTRVRQQALLITQAGVITLAIISGCGYAHQAYKIFSKKSAQSLSGYLFIAVTFVFIAGALYGAQLGKKVMLLSNGLRAPLAAAVVGGIAYYGGLSPGEWIAVASVVGAGILAYTKPAWSGWMCVGSAVIGLAGVTRQIYEMIAQGHPGVISLPLLGTQLVNAIFWTTYLALYLEKPCFADRVLTWCCGTNIILTGILMVLWARF